MLNYVEMLGFQLLYCVCCCCVVGLLSIVFESGLRSEGVSLCCLYVLLLRLFMLSCCCLCLFLFLFVVFRMLLNAVECF